MVSKERGEGQRIRPKKGSRRLWRATHTARALHATGRPPLPLGPHRRQPRVQECGRWLVLPPSASPQTKAQPEH